MNEEKKKCYLCQKRYVKQQEWKDEREKCFCMKCWVFLKAMGVMEDELNWLLKNNGGFYTNPDKNGRRSRVKVSISFINEGGRSDLERMVEGEIKRLIDYRNK